VGPAHLGDLLIKRELAKEIVDHGVEVPEVSDVLADVRVEQMHPVSQSIRQSLDAAEARDCMSATAQEPHRPGGGSARLPDIGLQLVLDPRNPDSDAHDRRLFFVREAEALTYLSPRGLSAVFLAQL